MCLFYTVFYKGHTPGFLGTGLGGGFLDMVPPVNLVYSAADGDTASTRAARPNDERLEAIAVGHVRRTYDVT